MVSGHETTATGRHPRLAFRLPLDPARLLRARERLRDYLYQQEIGAQAINDIVLAIEEAMTNAVRHSEATSDLEVDLEVQGDELLACVRDHGRGFPVERFDPEVMPDLLAPGGRGLYLISRLMDELELRRNHGIEVRMRKRGLPLEKRSSPLNAAFFEESALLGETSRHARRRTLVEEMAESFASVDWEYRITYANKAALELFGMQLQDVLGTSFWDLFPQTRGMAVGDAVRRAMEVGLGSIEEYVSPLRGRWVETRIYPTESGVSIYVRDIDERKRRELERDTLFAGLAESEQRFRSLFDSMTEGVALHEMVYEGGEAVDYTVLDVNSAFALQTGIDPEAVRGQLASAAYGAGEAPYLREYSEVVEGRGPVEFETFFPPLERYFRISAVAMMPHHFATIFEDVTEDRQAQEALRRSEEKYRGLFESLDEGFCIVEVLFDETGAAEDYCFLEVNPAYERHTGIHDAVGRCARELVPDLERHWFEVYGQVARSGVARRFELAAPSIERDFDVYAFRIGEPDEHRVAMLFRDVTEGKRTEAALREAQREATEELEFTNALLEAARALTSSVGLRAVLEALADVTLRSLHLSRLVVLGYEESGEELETLLVKGPLALPEGTRLQLESLSSELQRAVRERRTVVADYDRVGFPDEMRRIAGETKARLAVWVPMVWQERLLGLVGIDEPGEQRVLTAREVELVEAICAQAAVAVANAASYEAQYTIATTLQENLRHPLPEVRGLELGLTEVSAFEPALVGGDFWDVMELGDRRVLVAIGDVAGKGIAAAGLTETVRSTIRAFATVDTVPAFILRKANELLLREPQEAYVTALVAIVDLESGHVSLGSAGHPGPVLLGPSTCAVIDPHYGPPLGTFRTEYVTKDIELSSEDYLLLYTDGVTEARVDGKLLGEGGLLRASCGLRGKTAQDIADGIREAVVAYASRLTDDLQVLVLRRG